MIRVAIAGLGLVGGSLARALRERSVEVHGVDPDASALDAARAAGLLASASPSLADCQALGRCDALVLAAPASTVLALLAQAPRGLLVTDVAGAKARVAAEAARLGVRFVGAHPMAGSEKSGFAASRAELFRGATVAICAEGAAPEDVERVEAMWRLAGARPVRTTAAEHDAAVALCSHLPYAVAAALVAQLGAGPALARGLAASGFRDTTRVAGDGTVGDAAAMNAALPVALRDLAARLASAADALERDPESQRRAWLEARAQRAAFLAP